MKTKAAKKAIDKIACWNDHIDKKYGKAGTATRAEFEIRARAFVIGKLSKEGINRNLNYQ